MKTTVQHVMDSTIALTAIINDNRALPLKGKFLVARLHTKLLAEFKIFDAQRDEMIKAYGFHPVERRPTNRGPILNPEDPRGYEEIESLEFQVPADKMPEFTAAWKQIGDTEIEIDAQPIPISALSLGDDVEGEIHAHELITLGSFVAE